MLIFSHSLHIHASSSEEISMPLSLRQPLNCTSLRGPEIVQHALRERGINAEVIEFHESTRTAQEAAITIGCDIGQITKSLIFQTKETHKPVLILVSGKNRVKESLISNLLGEKILKADADFVKNVTGFAIGGVPPIGHHQIIEHIFIDEDLLLYGKVWAAGGTPHSLFEISSTLLKEITNGIITRVTNM